MKAILFDLDGTLIDSSEGITKSVQYTLDYYGIDEPDLEKLKCFIGPPLRGSFMKYYNFSEEQAVEATIKYRERYQPIGVYECRLYPDVEKCIRALKDKGYMIGMASSKPEVMCRTILKHFNILDLFDDVVGASMDGKIDTKEEVLNEVMRRWGSIDKKDMCLMGDTLFDVEGANQVGIKCIGVSFGFGDTKEMLDAGAITICDSMMELLDIIVKLK